MRRLIVSGEVVSGGALQPTNLLMQRFGVSRATLREAFRILETERLVSVRRGSRTGVRVLEPGIDSAAHIVGQTLQATGATIGDLYQAQLALEPFAAALLAERRDRRDIMQLRSHLAQLELTLNGGEPSVHAVELARFHRLLVDLSGNKVLSLTAGLIAEVLERHRRSEIVNADMEHPTEAARHDFADMGLRSIAKLVAMIEAGDAPGAEQHWREHVQNANSFWLRFQDQFAPVTVVV